MEYGSLLCGLPIVASALSEAGQFDIIVTFLNDRKKALIEKDNLAGLLSDLNENDFNEILECYHNRGQDWFKGRDETGTVESVHQTPKIWG